MGAEIVYADQGGALSGGGSGLSITIENAPAGSLPPGQTNGILLIGDGNWGPVDQLQLVSGTQDVRRACGSETLSPTNVAYAVVKNLEIGVTNIGVIRISDDSDTAAVVNAPDNGNPSKISLVLTAAHTGSGANTAVITLEDAPSSTTANPARRLTIAFPLTNDVEVFDNIQVASTATDSTAIINAVNNGIGSQGPSKYFIASPPGIAPASPAVNGEYAIATAGTDGASGIVTADFLGSATAIPPTGMHAATGQISGFKISCVGCTDVATLAGPMQAFALSENAMGNATFPEGTTSDDAIAQKKALGISTFAMNVWAGDFLETVDTTNGGVHRFIPTGDLAGTGRIALTPPQRSPANLPIPNVVGTTRTGSKKNVPYGRPERKKLEQAGINFVWMTSFGGSYPSIAHNKNSLGSLDTTFRGNIAYTTMTEFFIGSLDSTVLGAIYGRDQGQESGDPVRGDIRSALIGLCQPLKDKRVIDLYTPVCDLSNNTVGPNGTIANGDITADLSVTYRAIVDNINIRYNGGQTVFAITPGAVTTATSK